MRSSWALLAASLAAAALAGCAPSPAPAAVPAPAPPPLTGTFGQGRSQVEAREAKATLTLAEGATPVEVTALELLVPGFTSAGPAPQSTLFEPGRTVALPAGYGTPTCAADDDDVTGRPVQALATVTGAAEPVRVVLDDPDDRAGKLRERECAAQRLAALVPLAWQPQWRTEGSGDTLVAVGRLDVGPVTGDEPVTLEALDPTTLFDYALAAPVVLGPGERATVDVRLAPARCDPHAVAEDKVGFAPRATVRVGEEVLTAPVWVALQDRRVALDALAERCGTG